MIYHQLTIFASVGLIAFALTNTVRRNASCGTPSYTYWFVKFSLRKSRMPRGPNRLRGVEGILEEAYSISGYKHFFKKDPNSLEKSRDLATHFDSELIARFPKVR